jgi:hypothetical protein
MDRQDAILQTSQKDPWEQHVEPLNVKPSVTYGNQWVMEG